MINGVDGPDAFQNVLDGSHHRIFAGLNGKAFMPHVLKGNDFLRDLFLGQFLAGHMLVLPVIGAVHAAVDAVVGKIERGEEHNAVAVEFLLYLFSEFENGLHLVRQRTGQQSRCFPVGKPLAQLRLFNNAVDFRRIVAVPVCVFERGKNFIVINELFGM